jgi:3-methyladenine DNA glycosylase AlkD
VPRNPIARLRSAPQITDIAGALDWLKRKGTKKTVAGMARYGIPATKAFGVTVGEIKAYGKQLGKDHELAQALWASGWYEARLLAAFIDDPDAVTSQQMDAWANDFDSWAVCDTVCFHLFDRTALAWPKVRAWARVRPEFKKRAAFALLWGLTVHDKKAPDDEFLACLPLIERAADDERDYVKKAVDMALRALGKRNAELREAALKFARQLSTSEGGARPWLGRSALRELGKASGRTRARRSS